MDGDLNGRYSSIFGAGQRVTFNGKTYVEKYRDHVERMKEPGEFCDDTALQAAADNLCRKIEVFQVCPKGPGMGNGYMHLPVTEPRVLSPLVDDNREPIRLLLSHRRLAGASHYQLLIFKEADETPALLEECRLRCDGPSQVLRCLFCTIPN